MKIVILDCHNSLKNYAFLIIDPITSECALIDTLETHIITNYLRDNGLKLKYILNTHHHNDHIGGNLSLQNIYDCSIYANYHDKHRISGITHPVYAGDKISLFNGQIEFQVIEYDGHTIGHIGFYEEKRKWLFSGDTLFNLGCGRRFEGSVEQYYNTLQKITALPSDTLVYGSHEYTLDNIQFAKHIIPSDYADYPAFLEYCDMETEKRKQNIPTIPFRLESQKKFNPFLLSHIPHIQNYLRLKNRHPSDVFGHTRSLKDNFVPKTQL